MITIGCCSIVLSTCVCVCVCVCVCARTLAVCSSKIFHYGRVLLNVCLLSFECTGQVCKWVTLSPFITAVPLFCCAAGLQFDFLGSASPIQTMSGCHYVGIFFFFFFFFTRECMWSQCPLQPQWMLCSVRVLYLTGVLNEAYLLCVTP